MHLLHKFEDGFEAYFTSRDEGDARRLIAAGAINAQLESISAMGHHLRLVRQTHSSDVLVIDSSTKATDDALIDADGVVTNVAGVVPGVLVADCAPVALVSEEGVFSTVHAGWRGLYGGVIESAVVQMNNLGAKTIKAYVGPCIKSECYEFAPDDLADISAHLGSDVSACTSWGTNSLDMASALNCVFQRLGVTDVTYSPVCTACHTDYFSHRSKKSLERHLMLLVDVRRGKDA